MRTPEKQHLVFRKRNLELHDPAHKGHEDSPYDEDTPSRSQGIPSIHRVPMSSSTRTGLLNWAIWTFPKSLKRDSSTPRQALPTTLLQKCGRTSPTTTNPISGHWDASSTRWSPSNRPFEPRTWRASTKKLLKAPTPNYQPATLQTLPKSLSYCFK